jgi:6-phosphogluconolactonase
MSNVRIVPDLAALVTAAADEFVASAATAVSERGRFTVALSGGNTPKPIYERLATPGYADRIDWSATHVLWGDERCVPPDDERSNYRMAREALLAHVPIPEGNVHRMRGEDPPEAAARSYETELRELLGAEPIDLVHLGMGDNGHTASLFPGLPGVSEREHLVLAQYVEVVGMWRLTMTPPVLRAARRATFLVSGPSKAEMLARVLDGPRQPVVLPSQSIDTADWLVDAPAAKQLKPR